MFRRKKNINTFERQICINKCEFSKYCRQRRKRLKEQLICKRFNDLYNEIKKRIRLEKEEKIARKISIFNINNHNTDEIDIKSFSCDKELKDSFKDEVMSYMYE